MFLLKVPRIQALPEFNPAGRNAALGGALVGMFLGYALTRSATGVILGTAAGMVATPLLTGTPPRDLGKALFGRA